MEENRNVKVSVMLSPSELARLDAYARDHRWSRSAAVAVLIDHGLTEAAEGGSS